MGYSGHEIIAGLQQTEMDADIVFETLTSGGTFLNAAASTPVTPAAPHNVVPVARGLEAGQHTGATK